MALKFKLFVSNKEQIMKIQGKKIESWNLKDSKANLVPKWQTTLLQNLWKEEGAVDGVALFVPRFSVCLDLLCCPK